MTAQHEYRIIPQRQSQILFMHKDGFLRFARMIAVHFVQLCILISGKIYGIL